MCARKSAASSPGSNSSDPATEALLGQVVRALDDKKASDLRVLRVRDQSSITDYLVLATGNAHPHLRALRVELEKVLDAAGAKIAGMELGDQSGWLVVDAYQIMIHLFLPEQREHYRLEQLWQDATEVDVPQLLSPAPKPAKKRATKKTPAKKKAAKPAAKKATKKKRG